MPTCQLVLGSAKEAWLRTASAEGEARGEDWSSQAPGLHLAGAGGAPDQAWKARPALRGGETASGFQPRFGRSFHGSREGLNGGPESWARAAVPVLPRTASPCSGSSVPKGRLRWQETSGPERPVLGRDSRRRVFCLAPSPRLSAPPSTGAWHFPGQGTLHRAGGRDWWNWSKTWSVGEIKPALPWSLGGSGAFFRVGLFLLEAEWIVREGGEGSLGWAVAGRESLQICNMFSAY